MIDSTLLSSEDVFQLLKRFVSPSNCIMFRCNAEGIIVSAEGDGLALFERRLEDVIGKSFSNVCKNFPQLLNAFQTALSGESTQYADSFFNHFLNFQFFPLRNGNSIVGVNGFVVDETEKMLKQRERMLAAVMNFSTDGILTISDIANGINYNARLLELFDGDVAALIADFDNEELRKIAMNPEEIWDARRRNRETARPQQGTLYLHDGRIYDWDMISAETGLGDSRKTCIWKFHDVTDFHQTAELIRWREEQYRLLFESMINGMVLADVIRDENHQPTDFLIANANPSFAASLGMVPQQLLGQSLLKVLEGVQILSHDFGNKWWQGLADASFGQSGTFHIRISNKTSPYHKIVVFQTQQDQIGILQYDETEQVRSERSLQMMQVIIDRISEPVLRIGLDGVILYANDAAYQVAGYNGLHLDTSMPEEMIGAKVWDFDTKNSPEIWSVFVEQLKEKTSLQFETVLRHYNRTTYPVTLTVDLLEFNGKQFVAASYRDITEQIHRIEAEQASVAKSRFLAHMSHEIRTPLNGILGFTDLLLNSKLDAKLREYVELAHASGKHLLAIVNDILDFTRIEEGKLELELAKFDLTEMIEDVINMLAPQAQKRNLKLCSFFATDIPSRITADPSRLRQVLVALLSNGIKFTKEGGIKLTVSVHVPKEQDCQSHYLRFEVIDTGIGISQEQLHLLFNSFSPLDSSFTKEYGGIGMGLAISHELIQLMGGEIGVESQEGVGSKFWFTIPLVDDQCDPTVRGFFQYGYSELTKQSIIVIDDDDIQRDVVVKQLESWGMNVRSCQDKNSALDEMHKAGTKGTLYRIAVIDNTFQEMTGWDLAKAIKSDPELSQTSVIMLTPLPDDIQKTDSRLGIIDQFVTKPVFGASLFNAVFSILNEDNNLALPDEDAKKKDGIDSEKEKIGKEKVNRESSAILIAEDNHINQIVVGEILSQAGFYFDVAVNGQKAVEAYMEKKYALILMDCQMPVMDGFEATKKIRALESEHLNGYTPIVALTANAMPGDEEHCLAIGMDAFCSKPVNAAKLIEIIQFWIGKNNK